MATKIHQSVSDDLREYVKIQPDPSRKDLEKLDKQLAQKASKNNSRDYAYEFKEIKFTDATDFTIKKVDGTPSTNTFQMNSEGTKPNAEVADYTLMFSKNITMIDGRLSCLITKTDVTTAGTWAGLIFAGNKGQTKALSVGYLWATQSLTLRKWDANGASKFTTIQTAVLTDTSQMPSADKPMLLEVEVTGELIDVYVNGKKVISSINLTDIDLELYYHEGHNGFIHSNHTTVRDVTFKNVVIQERRYDTINKEISKILSVGDSVTAGSGASVPEKRWVNRLASYTGITVQNQGVGGVNTNWVLHNEVTPYLDSTHDLVTILCGTNDLRTDTVGLNIEDTERNYSRMIKKIKANGSIPVLCTITPFPIDRDVKTGTTTIDSTSFFQLLETNSMIRKLCKKERIRCCDNFNITNFDFATYFDADLLHPNDAGHQKIYEQMYFTIFGVYPS